MKFFAIFQSFREGGFIRSFFLGARRTNPEGLPFLLTPPSLRTPPLYFLAPHPAMLRGTAGEEGESNPPLIAERYSAYGARQGEKVEY